MHRAGSKSASSRLDRLPFLPSPKEHRLPIGDFPLENSAGAQTQRSLLTPDSTRKRPSLPASCDPGIRPGFASSLTWPYLVQTRWYMHNASTILTQLSKPGMSSAAGCKQNSAPTSRDKQARSTTVPAPPRPVAPESIKAPEFLFNLLTTRGGHLKKECAGEFPRRSRLLPCFISVRRRTASNSTPSSPRKSISPNENFPATDFSLLFHHLFHPASLCESGRERITCAGISLIKLTRESNSINRDFPLSTDEHCVFHFYFKEPGPKSG